MENSAQQVASSNDILILTLSLPTTPCPLLFTHWLEPDLLTRWWVDAAAVEPRIGGEYHLSWPSMNWQLCGQIVAFEPPSRFAFTWYWPHEPDAPPTTVTINIMPQGRGSHLTLTHGPYADTPADQQRRVSEHLTGWQHFLGKLAALLEGDRDQL